MKGQTCVHDPTWREAVFEKRLLAGWTSTPALLNALSLLPKTSDSQALATSLK